jgi:hypothetical protein
VLPQVGNGERLVDRASCLGVGLGADEEVDVAIPARAEETLRAARAVDAGDDVLNDQFGIVTTVAPLGNRHR